MNYSAQAMGQTIRELRENQASNVSQEELGRMAAYGKGAGVSISRIESGQTSPTRAKLAGIADALGVTVQQLELLASEREEKLPPHGRRSTPATRITSASLKKRVQGLESKIRARGDKTNELSEKYGQALQAAREEFLLPFTEWASDVQGQGTEVKGSPEQGTSLPNPASYLSTTALTDSLSSAGEIPDIYMFTSFGKMIGSAASNVLQAGIRVFGTASTGTAISDLNGIAKTNATTSIIGGGTLANGGGGIARGNKVLSALVIAPMISLGIAASIVTALQIREDRIKLATQLDYGEQKFGQMTPGVDALHDFLFTATDLLNYVATYASHSFQRWIGSSDKHIVWTEMSAQDKSLYNGFVEIAGCEVAIEAIDTTGFLTMEGADLEDFIVAVAAMLDHATKRVRALV